MNLKQAALIAEIVGAIGVIVSIVYLASEVSQNTANIRAANSMSLYAERSETVRLLVGNPEIMETALQGFNGNGGLTELDQLRFSMLISHLLDQWELSFELSRNGLMFEENADVNFVGYCQSLRSAAVRDIFEANAASGYHRAAFVEYARPCFKTIDGE